MTRVLGLDPSYTRFGVALPTGRTLSWTWRSTTLQPSKLNIGRRLHHFAGELARVCAFYRPELAIIEGYAPHSPGIMSTIRLAELGGVIRLVLFEHDVQAVEVAPSELKKWATGKGTASKEEMLAAALARGAEPRNHDEADAALLRLMHEGLDLR